MFEGRIIPTNGPIRPSHLQFVAVEVGPPVDMFGGAKGEANARRFEVFGHPFLADKPQ
jgi:hypothetical protein